MPGIPAVPGTRVGISLCRGEGYLERAAINSAAFAIDVNAVRDMVASGTIEPQEGVERVDHAGALSPRIEAQLRECLGRIAAGTCQVYHNN